jgi:hypothetical protein
MASGQKEIDPALSPADLAAAIRTLWHDVIVDNRWWVPELGGTARDWVRKTVYFDHRLPRKLVIGGKTMDVFRYLLIHECVERTLMDELGLPYALAHTFATGAERAAVEADGFSWNDYTLALRPWIKLARTKPKGVAMAPGIDDRPMRADHFH